MKSYLKFQAMVILLLVPLFSTHVWANDGHSNTEHSQGFVFSRTDKVEYRWIDVDSTGGLGNVWIDEECANRLGPPQATGAWSDLIALSPGFDAIESPCNEMASPTIVGSWNVTIEFPTGNSIVMYSFHGDGTITESDNPGFDPGFGGDALSPALGQWKKTTNDSGVAKYQKLAFNQQGQLSTVYTGNVTVRADSSGTLIGTLSIDARIPGGEDAQVFSGLPFTATRIAP